MTSSHPLICCIGVLHTVVLAGVRNADMQQNFLGTRVIEQSFGHPSRTGARSRLTRPRLPKCLASRLGNLIRWEHHEAPEPGMVLPPAMKALYAADDHGLKIASSRAGSWSLTMWPGVPGGRCEQSTNTFGFGHGDPSLVRAGSNVERPSAPPRSPCGTPECRGSCRR